MLNSNSNPLHAGSVGYDLFMGQYGTAGKISFSPLYVGSVVVTS